MQDADQAEQEESCASRVATKPAVLPDRDQLVQILDTVPEPIFVKDEQHRWVYMNDAFVEKIGYSRDTLLGKSDYEFFPKAQADVFWERDNRVFSTGIVDTNVEQARDASGIVHTIATRKSLVQFADGTRVLVGAIQDITDFVEEQERKDAELQRTHEQLVGIVRHGPVSIATYDKAGVIATAFGFESGSILTEVAVGKNLVECFASWPQSLSAIDRASKGNKALTVLERGERWFELQIVPQGARGESAGGLLLVQEITERYALQKRLAETDRLDALGQLARGVAHDFNGLLTVISSAAELAKTHIRTDHAQNASRCLEIVQDAVDKSTRLTRQLLSFSKEQVIRFEPVDFNQLLLNVQDLLQRALGDSIQFVLTLYPKPVVCMVDASQIEQVLLNLCFNSSHAMPDGGTLEIQTAINSDMNSSSVFPKSNQFGLIRVSDTGSGIPADIVDKIFEPLFSTKRAGTGIGLSTCRNIVRQHGGTISVRSEIGKGSEFLIHLPLHGGFASVTTAKSNRKANEVTQGQSTVLLVEDDEMLRETISLGLEERGFIVRSAANGHEAVTLVESDPSIEIVITDVVMPQMSGPELIKWLGGRLPSIFVTGYADDVVTRSGLSSAEINYLAKPYNVSALASKITEVLDRARSNAASE
ncbi:MAG: ATP-binding protein [Polyangiales bacterium]